MPITLPASLKSQVEKPHGSAPLVWFVEIQLAKPFLSGITVVPSLLFRITTRETQTDWPASSPSSERWYPFNFGFTPIEQNQEGDLQQLDLSVDNSTGVLMRYLHDGDGLEGNYCKLFLVATGGLGIAYPDHEFQRWDLQIAGATANDSAVTFRLERANFFSRMVPQDRFVAERCRWEFGGLECGYVINSVAAFHTCDRTVDNCVARGLDHAARGLPVLHPGRFGGNPGIPQQRLS